jgi:DedD protein
MPSSQKSEKIRKPDKKRLFTMEEKNELNDIILNKGSSSGGPKKVLLAIATFAILLIIVVVVMNRLNTGGTDNLPQAVPALEPQAGTEPEPPVVEDPLFEPIEVIEETAVEEQPSELDKVAQKIKQQTLEEEAAAAEQEVIVEEPVVKATEVKPAPVAVAKPQPVAKPKPAAKTKPSAGPVKGIAKGSYYIQVGSFAKYEPNKKFLKSISDTGYSYTYDKRVRSGRTITRVLVGPFETERSARNALPTIRKNVEAGAFLTKM